MPKNPYVFKLGAFPSFTIVFTICLVCIVFVVFALTMPYFLIATLTLCTIEHIFARTHLTGVVSVWLFNFLNL